MKRKKMTTKQLTTIAILSAVAAVLFTIEIPIVLFYKLDLSNLPVLLGAFAMGPLPGLGVLLIKSLLGLLHTTSQGVGELADFLMGLCMTLPAALLYQRDKTRRGAIRGLAVGSVVATAAAAAVNLFLLIPFYGAVYHLPVEQIVEMGSRLIPAVQSEAGFILLVTTPFNLLKWVVISVAAILIYKPLSPVLHRA